MQSNIGAVDRPIATSALRFRPLYAPFGISTCKASR